MKKINFGIIGTGRIAQQFLDEARKNKKIGLVGICARNYEKTKDIAKKYNIDRAYESSSEMLEDESIDAVYIATMHPTHFAYTMKALNAGKHVLCEKPAVLKKEELEEVIKSAGEKKLLFMEAVTVGFNPLYKQMKELIKSGEIGNVVHVESSYGSRSTKVHKHNPKQAGGALYDIGIYNIFFLTDLLGIPSELGASARKNEWGVEGSVTGLLEYQGGVTGSFYATMDSISGNSAKIIGTEGMIEIPDSWTVAEKFILKRAGEEDRNFEMSEDKWLGYEMDSFVETLLNGKTENEIMTYEKSLKLHETIDMIKEKLGFKYEGVEVEVY
ncbi:MULTISPECIES: Gfo/Idh/MocA family protein [Psychrilyobacter]|uniref:Gfo/Idh/MocA family oxidoreductase n=1 Tax=Psychrilyobacter piezotolerans TaxID=2293438 RepID=A0ABX9KI88_9FUSO|nr:MULTISPECIES: Gfo/Idh/MocA family oxidoreductase [Psychrilyobacter]MCS5420942.1 Gfo/Idh/MocA family oxidoreductase [Psychrilyobacter sp. S5]NDI77651.1 Gfo/Idh/MocA family oxidoreductase [Psychrilyobacter piezotolerans]RDE62659.1 gfo/Idh/MocA family oxidoreductase [Psychrilyobacter sp. S5]REI41589.1 gfo/Idh/MocA family oxidoreductase [Psychrilyobacter piezotolerans]